MIPLVTLTTDFGTASGYVAEVKGAFFRQLLAAGEGRAGVDLNACPLVDLAHDLPPHDVTAAAWFVASSCFGFPAGTLHAVVVDPGVGTTRPIVYAEVGDQRFLAPDNGLLSLAVSRHGLTRTRQVTVPAAAAATFHGRDVFAPTAARLVAGDDSALGETLSDLVTLPWPQPKETPEGILGEVIHVDHFGNLITNLPVRLLPRLRAGGHIDCSGTVVHRIINTYAEEAPGSLVALAGSQGFLEIAVVEGRADQRLAAGRGTAVRLAGGNSRGATPEG